MHYEFKVGTNKKYLEDCWSQIMTGECGGGTHRLRMLSLDPFFV